MSILDFIIELSCRVDHALPDVKKGIPKLICTTAKWLRLPFYSPSKVWAIGPSTARCGKITGTGLPNYLIARGCSGSSTAIGIGQCIFWPSVIPRTWSCLVVKPSQKSTGIPKT